MSSETTTLARFVAGLNFEDIPRDVIERTQFLIMDHVGIALRARYAADLNEAMNNALTGLGFTGGAASVIGDPQMYAPPAAAFYNGNLAHSLDFDDTHARGSIHPSAPILPAAFAAAEMTGADGRALIAGIIAGYETQIRISMALGPSEHYQQGFHPTATCGVFGAAAAAGRILDLSPEQVESAFGLCGSQAAGSMQFLADGSWNKPFHTGYAAMSGLISATLAQQGFTGAKKALEGNRGGFLNAYAPHPNPTKVISELGKRFETMEIGVKPYPSCRYGHAAIDALIGLRTTHQLNYQDIESVQVGLPKTGWNIVGDPESDKQNPTNYVEGQFSMPFVAAVALRDGQMTWDDYARHLGDSDTLALCRKIHTVVDDRAEAEFPANMSGVVEVATTSGTFEEMVVTPKGEPTNFLSGGEMRAKFDALVGPYLDNTSCGMLADAILSVEDAKNIQEILAMTRPSSQEPLRAVHKGT